MSILRYGVLAISCTILLPAYTNQNDASLQFTNYPASSVRRTSKAPIKLMKEDQLYKTRLRRGYSQKVNFAGKYILTLWGCGAECLMGAAINTETGTVHWLPGTVCCWHNYDQEDQPEIEPVEYKINSNLIILRGLINESGVKGSHYYQVVNDKFMHITTKPLASAP